MTDLVRSETHALPSAFTEDDNGHLFFPNSTFSKADVLQVPGSELGDYVQDHTKTYKVNRSREVLDRARESFDAAPVYLGHKQGGQPDGYVVGSTQWLNDTHLGGGIKVTSDEAKQAVRSGVVDISPEYKWTPTPALPGTDRDFDHLSVRVKHLAIVPRGKNGTTQLRTEQNMDPVTLSEEATTKLAEATAKANEGMFTKLFTKMGLIRGEEAPNKEPEKPTVRTEEDLQRREEEIKLLYADKAMVAPLLQTEQAKTLVKDATDSVQVLGVALSMKEEDAKSKGCLLYTSPSPRDS